MHTERSELAGQVFEVDVDHPSLGPGPHQFFVEDWWDRLTGESWMYADGNPACIMYAIRSGSKGLPMDDEVLYGHLRFPSGLGMLVHISEIPAEGEQS